MKYIMFFCLQYLWKNKKQSLYTIIGIMISTAFITTLIGFGFSLKNMFFEDVCNNHGRYDCLVNIATEEEVNVLSNQKCIEKIGIKKENIRGSFEGNELLIKQYNKEGIELDCISLESGRLPQNCDEIVLSTQIKLEDEYISDVIELGDEICVLVSGSMKSYFLVGILDDFDAGRIENDALNAIIMCDEENLMSDNGVSTCFLSLKNKNVDTYSKKIASLLNIPEDNIYETSKTAIDDEIQGIYVNDIVTGYYKFSLKTGENHEMITAIAICVVIIIIVSIILLSSRMLMAVERRRKELALLKMLGCGQIQLTFMLLIENLLLGIIGTSAGNGISQMLQYAMLFFVKKLRINSLDNILLIMDWKVYLSSSILMLFILLCISVIPVVIVAKLSPIEALRERIVIKNAKASKLKIVNVFKEKISSDTLLGMTYTTREKGRFILTLVSISCAGFIMLILFTVIQSVTFDIGKDGKYDDNTSYQYCLTTEENMDMLDRDYLKRCIPYIKEFSINVFPVGDFFLDMPYDEYVNPEVDEYMLHEYDEVFFPEKTKVRVYIEGEEEQSYNESILPYLSKEISYDEFVNSGAAIITDELAYWDENGNGVINNILNVNEGEKISFVKAKDFYTEREIEIGDYYILDRTKRTWKLESLENGEDSLPNIFVILPMEEVYGNFGDTYRALVKMNTDQEHIRDLGEWLYENSARYNITITDNVENILAIHDTNMIALVGIIFVTVFLVSTGSACVYYVIVTGINERKNDVRILRMLGMSKKQFAWMFGIEDLIYGFLGTMIGFAMLVATSHSDIWETMKIDITYKYMPINLIGIFILLEIIAIIASRKGYRNLRLAK